MNAEDGRRIDLPVIVNVRKRFTLSRLSMCTVNRSDLFRKVQQIAADTAAFQGQTMYAWLQVVQRRDLSHADL
jgi:hypothetical protein